MRFRTTLLAATVAAGTMGLAHAAQAGTIEVVSADDDHAKFHPRPVAVARASGADFQATMDQVFGEGRWRLTSGYRTRAQEDALRRQGAGTVAAGHVSRHSLGAPEAPGAYDAVVDGVPTAKAAAKLRQQAGGAFRVLAEGAHGPQGPHLHVELVSGPVRRGASQSADD
jgi:hypothetical protein